MYNLGLKILFFSNKNPEGKWDGINALNTLIISST